MLLLLALAFTLFGTLPAAAQEITCYTVADEGGGDGSGLDDFAEDLLTRVDPADPNPETNETSIGDGTGTLRIEASALNPTNGTLYAVNGGHLGTLDLESGSFSAKPSALGKGDGVAGVIEYDDVDGLTFDPDTGTLYGSQRVREGGPDVLLMIDPSTGLAVPDAFGPGDDYVQITPLEGETKVDDLAMASDGTLFAIVNLGGHGDQLVTLDPDTGHLTEVGPLGQDDMEGLTISPDGGLIGVTGKEAFDPPGEALWDIDPDTGEATNPRPLDNAADYESVACIAAAAPPPPPPEVGSITIIKDSVPNSGVDFGFTGDLGKWALDEDGGSSLPSSRTFGDLEAGSYEVKEKAVDGWKLTKIACTDPDDGTNVDVGDATATVDLDPGEDVVCTFTNTRLAVLGEKPPLPATGVPGLGILSLIGGGLITAGFGMRSMADRIPNAPRALRPGLLGAAAAYRVTGMPTPARRGGSRWIARGASAIWNAARVIALERGPPRLRSP